jgi:hypothetical protein
MLTARVPDNWPPFVRSTHLADLLCTTTNVVRDMVERGTLPRPLKLSRRLHLFDREQVVAALKRLETAGGAA